MNGLVSGLDESRSPSIYDYLAASMLAIFIVWLWRQTAIQFPQFFEKAPLSLVTAASYAVYIIGSSLVSYLVLEKNRSRQVTVGLKVGGFSFMASAAYFYLRSGTPLLQFFLMHASFIVALLFSFLLGGYLGAVVYIRRAMEMVETQPKEADTPQEEGATESGPGDRSTST